MNVTIKIQKILPNLILPKKYSSHSSGFDVHACIPQNISIPPLQRILIPTGFALEIPNHCEAQIRPRSGLALKYGLTILNSPATIDPDYRGHVQILLINLGSQPFTIHPQDRIAQILFQSIPKVQFQTSLQLSKTHRNSSGFGSTGI